MGRIVQGEGANQPGAKGRKTIIRPELLVRVMNMYEFVLYKEQSQYFAPLNAVANDFKIVKLCSRLSTAPG